MKKTLKIMVYAAILLLCSASVISCKNKSADVNTDNTTSIETEEVDPIVTTIKNYLINEIGKQYALGDVCIPSIAIVDTDESNPKDILVWGDFWVFNYNLSGDTLKTVSGGSHPGLMHLKQSTEGTEVIGFDVVADGSKNLQSAKEIFGEFYDAFQAINSNDEEREETRISQVADYVKENGIGATMLQDYGFPAIVLPIDEELIAE